MLKSALQTTWVVSSAVEHCLHTAGVTGSNPVLPTNEINDLRRFWRRFVFEYDKSMIKPRWIVLFRARYRA